MPCDYSPYTLPTIDFVAGETQDFAFYTYFYKSHQPFALSGCTANFSIVSFTNKTAYRFLRSQWNHILTMMSPQKMCWRSH